MKAKIGFVGLGRMGANMARHLADSGYDITVVYDIDSTIKHTLSQELKAVAADDLVTVTSLADVIITVVTNDMAMEQIYQNPTSKNSPDSLLVNAQGKTFINCATLSPKIQQKVEKLTLAAKAKCLEAAMASSITQAREGSLYLMVGGDLVTFDEQKSLLETLCVSLRYVGEMGCAAKVKALVNMVMNINTAALAEGLGLADALGLDLTLLREVFSQTGANSRVLETDAQDMQIRDHDCYFSCEHAAKDSSIANELAHSFGLQVPLSQATQAQYQKLIDLGLGHLDKSGIAELTFKTRTPNP